MRLTCLPIASTEVILRMSSSLKVSKYGLSTFLSFLMIGRYALGSSKRLSTFWNDHSISCRWMDVVREGNICYCSESGEKLLEFLGERM